MKTMSENYVFCMKCKKYIPKCFKADRVDSALFRQGGWVVGGGRYLSAM